jgi:NACHT domain
MLEWLATIGAAKLGEAVFEQVLKLGQSAAEDYVKDFFKSSLKEGTALAKPEVTKKAVASAVKEFLGIVTEELEDRELSRAQIRDGYEASLIQFVKDETVTPLLGKAFEPDCGAIDAAALAQIWQQSMLKGQPFPAMPDGFDWALVGSLYLKKVRRIVRETPELLELLKLALLEQQAESLKRLAGVNPGFDGVRYRESLQCSYGYLKLYTLDSTDRADSIKLWSMFIEQTVREALPPLRYEMPLDVKRQLQAEGGLGADLSPEALADYRQEYLQQPSRKVLAALADAPKAVILGDPGAGKSTLLQYVALEWVEGASKALPLLIELREYALAQVPGFLAFFHRGRGADWHFDSVQLDQYLRSQPTVVMFDGLDEVFDRATQGTIVDEIVRFGQMYPLAQVLVTSRIIGYNPERLQQAEFKQFTIQPLDQDERHEFIDRWYDLALGSDPDKARLVTRLKEAIANSKAIQNLADNPLLLTMMAILNRRQELPRDRADLYDQASRVLLYHWDVDHKRLQLPMDTIGRREKQEMLRLIAYAMQTSEEGLKGNLIGADRLTRILTEYLRDQGFEAPREKANGLIDQLRHRNWILSDRGADTYGFVHRTFLEYFCAMEIVHRFEKARTLTFEQLRDEVFGLHWQDETWHEVLRLICGAIDSRFAGELVEFLMDIKEDWKLFSSPEDKKWVSQESFDNLLIASDFSLAIKGCESVKGDLINGLKRISISKEYTVTYPSIQYVFEAIAKLLPLNSSTFNWLHDLTLPGHDVSKRISSIRTIGRYYNDLPEVLVHLMLLSKDENESVRVASIQSIANYFGGGKSVSIWLNSLADQSADPYSRAAAREIIIEEYSGDLEALEYLKKIAGDKTDIWIAQLALNKVVKFHHSKPEILQWLKTLYFEHLRGGDDSLGRSGFIRGSVMESIIHYYVMVPEIIDFICLVGVQDSFRHAEVWNERYNPRRIALEALIKSYTSHPKTLELLHDRALNDPDNQLRQWAQEQLQKLEVNP